MRRAIISAALLIGMMSLGSFPSYGKTPSGVLETVGVGLPDPSILNETQRRAMSREAAIAEAQAKMLAMLQNGSAETGILRDAHVVKTQWTRDGSCRITLRLKKP